MALYYFKCIKCNKEFRKISLFKEPQDLKCKICNELLVRTPKAPQEPIIMETLDNGVMAKAVTRIKDAEEIVRDRAEKDTAEKGKPLDLI